jgi:peptidoglycan hydrolase-like protein with peptidoglycan-binding domain
MNPILLKYGAFGLIAYGIYQILGKKSPLSTQATPVIPQPQPIPSAPKPAAVGDATTAAIQNRLNLLGASPALVVDGISGPKTLAAIKAFQASHGIDPDGIVGPITLAALGLGAAPVAASAATTYYQPAVTSAVTATPSGNTFHQTIETWADEPEESLVDHF